MHTKDLALHNQRRQAQEAVPEDQRRFSYMNYLILGLK
jgi:hypothetical protein